VPAESGTITVIDRAAPVRDGASVIPDVAGATGWLSTSSTKR
jgi:hypothetical protein